MYKFNVSVIVPVYNVEDYLEKCLESLVNQDFENYEIIIVNDGSPDNSQHIIDKYVKNYPNLIRGYKKENGGLSSARNYGIKKAKGEYIVFVDSDDYVTQNYLSALYNEATSKDYDIVACNIIKKNNSNEEVLKCYIDKNNTPTKNLLLSLPTACNKIYKIKLFVENKIYYPEKIFYEDLATTGRLLVCANKVTYINQDLYYYIERDSSIMHQTKYNPKMSDIFKSLEILTNYYKDNNYSEKYKDEIEYLHISHLLHDHSLRVYKYIEGKEEIEKVVNFFKKNYPNWKKNKYYKKTTWKYKMVCTLIYYKQIEILKKILK